MFLKATTARANTLDPNCIAIPDATIPDTVIPNATPGHTAPAPQATPSETSVHAPTTVDVAVPEGTGNVSIELILLTIRTRESGGDYTAHATKGTASGAYQFI